MSGKGVQHLDGKVPGTHRAAAGNHHHIGYLQGAAAFFHEIVAAVPDDAENYRYTAGGQYLTGKGMCVLISRICPSPGTRFTGTTSSPVEMMPTMGRL